MTPQVTGVVLAGGLSTRFKGENKAFFKIGGRRLIDIIHDIFRDLFEERILVTNQPLDYLDWDGKIVTDIYPLRSSLTGIHAGLFYASHPFAFFSACDTPFLKKAVVEAVLGAVSEDVDVVIPKIQAGLEPLCAAYSRRCLEPVARCLERRDLTIRKFFNKLRVKAVSEARIRRVDPELESFLNINTPSDLAAFSSDPQP
jgi:molybdopterin-guanine dinucleotide biosynthesis protein A